MPSSPSRPPATSRPFPLVPVVIGLIVVLGVIAVFASMGSGGSDDDVAAGVEENRPVEVEGDALPELEDPGADAALGSPMPEVRGASFDGTEVAITDDGTPKVVVYVAHWCPHCQAEVPVITDWIDENGMPEGVDLYSVSTGTQADAPNYPPSAWLEDEGWPVPVLADDDSGAAATAAGLSGYPFFVAVGPDGEVVARTSGEIGVEQFEDLVDAARAGG